LPANDNAAKEKELTFDFIKKIIDEAASLGALWCLITGGEPLLRTDFFDIYLYLKKKGLLVSVFTNATLITERHAEFFKKYPPRDIEITVYGITKETYERVTRMPSSFDAFMRGLDILLKNGINVRLKTMALRSNIQEFSAISQFCLSRTKDYFRFDPFLHLRFDGDSQRNEEIKSERLSPSEIVTIEKQDTRRFQALRKQCQQIPVGNFERTNCNHLFTCGTGKDSFTISYDGFFRLCSSLWHPNCIFDVKRYSISKIIQNFIPKVRDLRSNNKEFLQNCRACPIINFCMWCPAHCYLETGQLDIVVDYFCKVAHARVEQLLK